MSDEHTPLAPSYKDLCEQLESLKATKIVLEEKATHWRERCESYQKLSDTNADNGKEWKKLADAQRGQMDSLQDAYERAQIEAAELRGYIRRVNELDPEGRRVLDNGYPENPADLGPHTKERDRERFKDRL